MYARHCRALRRAASADPATIQALGELVDVAGDLKREWGLELSISAGTHLLANVEEQQLAGLLHYFVANAWSGLRTLRHGYNSAFFSWDEPEGVEEIAHLRAASEALTVAADSPLRRLQVLTNLGNAMSSRGRLIEAIESWDAALNLKPDFGMAAGNRGGGLYRYASLVHDPLHQGYLLREAHRSLLAAQRDHGVPPNAAATFARIRKRIEDRAPISMLQAPQHPWEPSRSWTAEERAYRTWCARERLFLNALNDISTDPTASADVLALPSIVTPFDEGPALLGFFNQLKQEFIAARLLLYRGTHVSGVHYADRDVTLINTLDYPVYSIGAEEVKLAYRSMYSMFDKIGFFLNDYFELAIPEHLVWFKWLWYEERQPETGPRADLVRRRNAPLRGLFWLSQDLFAPGKRSSDLSAQQMDKMRHELEHKYLKLHEYRHSAPGRSTRPGEISHDRLAYSVNVTEFIARAIRLARLVRAALIYLVFSVRIEEQQRAAARPAGTVTVPIDAPRWEDEWKL